MIVELARIAVEADGALENADWTLMEDTPGYRWYRDPELDADIEVFFTQDGQTWVSISFENEEIAYQQVDI